MLTAVLLVRHPLFVFFFYSAEFISTLGFKSLKCSVRPSDVDLSSPYILTFRRFRGLKDRFVCSFVRPAVHLPVHLSDVDPPILPFFRFRSFEDRFRSSLFNGEAPRCADHYGRQGQNHRSQIGKRLFRVELRGKNKILGGMC